MKVLNTVSFVALVLVGPVLTRAESQPSPTTTSSTINQDGVQFVLANSTNSNGVATEEYYVKGETSESWSQSLTFQRINLPTPSTVELFVAGFKNRLEAKAAKFRMVQQGKSAAVFGVRYPPSESGPEQVVLVFIAKMDPRKPNELQVTQFAVNPSKMAIQDMEVQMKRWQSRFQAEAATIK